MERPVEEMAKRRIGFYQRQGFVLWKKDYRQPPYKPGDHFLPMYLMVHGNLDPEKDYEDIKHKLHTVVYGAKEWSRNKTEQRKGFQNDLEAFSLYNRIN